MAIQLTNNNANDQYGFLGREWTSKPIKCDYVKLFLSEDTIINETLTIVSKNSTGTQDVREYSLSNYINATDRSSKIVLIPLKPQLILDGSTYFKIRIPAQSSIDMIFYYKEQFEILQ